MSVPFTGGIETKIKFASSNFVFIKLSNFSLLNSKDVIFKLLNSIW